MEIAILKRETFGNGPNVFNENDTITKYEIMDGTPVKGESIPVRLFLASYELTPTMREVAKRFSVQYFLNLVLVDEEDRSYFKQQEITLYRRAEIPPRKPLAEQFKNLHMDPNLQPKDDVNNETSESGVSKSAEDAE
uniref:Uncharacterized protein n=1 Tax=Acrobeloides nanus TaxID=290746 RepID=A0A914DF45_9BILA